MIEHRHRSLVKSIIWRVLAFLGTLVTTWWITGDVKDSSMLSIILNVGGFIFYYINERIWNRLSWGKKPHQIHE